MALYLSHLFFKNIRGFKEFDLSFDDKENHQRQWTIFIGNNGHGKTTVLRAIAIGLSDERTSSELLSLLPGEFVRISKKGVYQQPSLIITTLRDSNSDRIIKITTHLESDGNGAVRVRKEIDDGKFSWNDLFVCGYGSNRGNGGRMHSGYALRNSLLTLFNDKAGLIEPESVLRDFALLSAEYKGYQPDPQDEMHNLLRKLWGLQQSHKLEVTAEKVIIHGPWGGIPFHALGDGYRGTGSWLLDLVGNNLKAGHWFKQPKIAGIVLLDEMDEHLHPKWQKNLVPTLRKLFPNIQFIATTQKERKIKPELRRRVLSFFPSELDYKTQSIVNEVISHEISKLSESEREKLISESSKKIQNIIDGGKE